MQYKFLLVQENQGPSRIFSLLLASSSRRVIRRQTEPIPGLSLLPSISLITFKPETDPNSKQNILMASVMNFIDISSCLEPTFDELYCSKDSRSYLDQCFVKQRNIGEGSFGSV